MPARRQKVVGVVMVRVVLYLGGGGGGEGSSPVGDFSLFCRPPWGGTVHK